MLYLRTNYFLISDITKSYSLTYLDYISFSASKMKCKFSSLLLKPCEGSFWYRSQLQAACVTSDRWGTRRGAERGRGDMGRRLTTMDQAVVWRCFSPGCSSVDVEHLWQTLLPGNASLWWVHSGPAEQREPNQSTSKFPPPGFQLGFSLPILRCCFTCTYLSHSETGAPIKILSLRRACKCACGGED